MEIRKKSFTAVELIMTMVLGTIIILGGMQILVSQSQFSIVLRVESNLQQEAVAVMSQINAKIRNSSYVVRPSGGFAPPTLAIYDANNNCTGSYLFLATIFHGGQLSYTDSAGHFTVVSNKLSSISFFNQLNPSEAKGLSFKVVGVNISVQDPNYSRVSARSLISTVFCKLSGQSLPVRLVDQNGAPKTPVSSFATIQAAINAASSTDTVQVSYNDGVPYTGILAISKPVTLKGAYNYKNWAQAPDPVAYETVIGDMTPPAIPQSITPRWSINSSNADIENFTFIGPGILSLANSSNSIAEIKNNIFKSFSYFAISIGGLFSQATIENNTFQDDIDPGSVSPNFVSYAICGGSQSLGNVTIQNNKFTNLSSCPVVMAGNGTENNGNGTCGTINIANNYFARLLTNSSNTGYITNNGTIITIRGYYHVIGFSVTNNTFKDGNRSMFSRGSLILFTQDGPMTVNNNYFTGMNVTCSAQNYPIGIVSRYFGTGENNWPNVTCDVKNNVFYGNVGVTPIYFYLPPVGSNSTPATIQNNTIINNVLTHGFGGQGAAQAAAIDIYYDRPKQLNVLNNKVKNNTLDTGGGAEEISLQTVMMPGDGCAVNNNIVSGTYGFYLTLYPPGNCTFTNNTVWGCSGGMYSGISVTNSIFGNTNNTGALWDAAPASVTYSDVQIPGQPGIVYDPQGSGLTNNISADPLFVNPNTDFHLQNGSQCSGAGTPSGTDMGAYSSPGSTIVGASVTQSPTGYIGSNLPGLTAGTDYISSDNQLPQ